MRKFGAPYPAGRKPSLEAAVVGVESSAMLIPASGGRQGPASSSSPAFEVCGVSSRRGEDTVKQLLRLNATQHFSEGTKKRNGGLNLKF